ncbi:MAG: hypothetical protein LBC61_04790 [Candidatus Peribacteria bacterium]|nr:hypothetical protein [Candidatus Peribacteria bacterium]
MVLVGIFFFSRVVVISAPFFVLSILVLPISITFHSSKLIISLATAFVSSISITFPTIHFSIKTFVCSFLIHHSLNILTIFNISKNSFSPNHLLTSL